MEGVSIPFYCLRKRWFIETNVFFYPTLIALWHRDTFGKTSYDKHYSQ